MMKRLLLLALLLSALWPGVPGPVTTAQASVLATEPCSGSGNMDANWTTVTGFVIPQMVSGACQPVAVAGNGSISLYTNATWPADQYAQLKINTLSSTNGRIASVVLRGTTAARTQYECTAFGPLGATTTLTIYRYNAGTPTTTQTTGAAATVASGDAMKCTVVDSGADAIIKLYINAVEKLSWTDTTRINSGSPGIVLYTSTGTVANVQVDDWEGGDIPAAVGTLLKNVLPGFMEVDE